jgi:hypothetical protein
MWEWYGIPTQSRAEVKSQLLAREVRDAKGQVRLENSIRPHCSVQTFFPIGDIAYKQARDRLHLAAFCTKD